MFKHDTKQVRYDKYMVKTVLSVVYEILDGKTWCKETHKLKSIFPKYQRSNLLSTLKRMIW